MKLISPLAHKASADPTQGIHRSRTERFPLSRFNILRCDIHWFGIILSLLIIFSIYKPDWVSFETIFRVV
ncbi:hypothetical protein AMTRI_Chr02g215880 [Amborella trichopoda]